MLPGRFASSRSSQVPRSVTIATDPRWRSDASGAGQVVTEKEMIDFARRALDIVIAWSPHDERTLGDLVESLERMLDEYQTMVWDLISKWSRNAGESAKAALRERI